MTLSGAKRKLRRFFSSNKPPRPPLQMAQAERPESERRGLEWDLLMSRSYKEMVEMDAYKHLIDQLVQLRQIKESVLVYDNGDLAEARATIKLVDTVLATPQYMISEGAKAVEVLRSIGREIEQ